MMSSSIRTLVNVGIVSQAVVLWTVQAYAAQPFEQSVTQPGQRDTTAASLVQKNIKDPSLYETVAGTESGNTTGAAVPPRDCGMVVGPGLHRTSALTSADMALVNELAKAAAASQNGVTKELLSSFSICGACSNFARLGEANDGGYLTCLDGWQNIKGILSLGVEQHDQFSLDANKCFDAPVGQFDCTVNIPASNCDKCMFRKQCIKGVSVPSSLQPAVTLAEALGEVESVFPEAANQSFLMKMDIEASEWAVLPTENVLGRFQQIIVEFHWLHDETRHANMLQGVNALLNSGFKVVHIHGNNFGQMYHVGPYSIPSVIEVTYARNVETRSECLKEQRFSSLDNANNPQSPELPGAVLP